MTGAPATVFEKKGNAVLGVDHRVGADALERSETQTSGGNGGQSAGVHAETSTGPADGDAVSNLRRGRPGIRRRPQRHLDTALGQLGSDLLEVTLASTALGMPRYRASRATEPRARALLPELVGGHPGFGRSCGMPRLTGR